MIIRIKRWYGPEYTIGKLTIDNEVFKCDTLEDVNRDTNKNGKFDSGEVKIAGKTCIPIGEYKITMNVKSPKYSNFVKYPNMKFTNGYMPRLINVPHFEGILIHTGTNASHTDGCILVGENKIKGGLVSSLETFKKLYNILSLASKRGEEIKIIIT